jgi:hypothetical protein
MAEIVSKRRKTPINQSMNTTYAYHYFAQVAPVPANPMEDCE